MNDFISAGMPVTTGDYLQWIEVLPHDVEDVKQVENFGQYARRRREFLGLSQRQVADFISKTFDIPWHQTVVAKIESGERQIKLAEALALSLAYGMRLDDLMTGWDLEGNAYLRSAQVSEHEELQGEVRAAQARWAARKEREEEAEERRT